MLWVDELRMETPEQIEVNLELAGLGSRFIAQLIDWLILVIATFILLFIGVIVHTTVAIGTMALIEDPPTVILAIVIAVVFLLWFGYGVMFEVRWNGQTPGKWIAGIRVIRDNGAPVNYQAAGIRNFLAVGDFFPIPIVFLLDALIILLNPRRQRLGDLAAGTIVVRERVEEHGKEPEDSILEYASRKYSFTNIQLAKLTTTDRIVLREFLRRCDDMEGFNGPRLARRLAKRYVAKTGYPRDGKKFRTGASARKFLASLLRDMMEYQRNK